MDLDRLTSWPRHASKLATAAFRPRCSVAGMRVDIPGGRVIRWSVIAGNIRLHRIIDEIVNAGDTVVDVGANIGYNTVYLSHAVGQTGRVIALEPAGDNLDVLRRQLTENGLRNVTVHAVAAGRARETRTLYLRGELSAVNSLFSDGCYGPVTATVPVPVVPVDDLVEATAAVVKIDVEGAEIDVLEGMPRLLRRPDIRLVVEWHPALQVAAGYEAGALPRWLWARGFGLKAVWHTRAEALSPQDVSGIASRLFAAHRSLELLAVR
jgi:FkbM family methyltransferase